MPKVSQKKIDLVKAVIPDKDKVCCSSMCCAQPMCCHVVMPWCCLSETILLDPS